MKMKPWYLLSFLLLNFLLSQGQERKSDDLLYGRWNSIGYGRQLEITKKHLILHDTYQSGCNLNTKLPSNSMGELFKVTRLSNDSLQIEVGFTRYDFVRSSESDLCKKSKNDPLSNFDALWETFNENYAFFDLREVNWLAIRDKYRSRLTKKSSDDELYTVLHEMILELDDGHVFLEIPESLEEKEDKEDKIGDNDESIEDLRKKVIYAINKKYIPNHKTYNKGMINWGLIDDSTSYLQFNDFEDLANYNISNALPSEEFTNLYWEKAEESSNYTQDVLDSFKSQMELIFEETKNTQFCIVDVRFNGGGFDQIGLEILSYFVDHRQLAFTKKARFDAGFTVPQEIFIEASDKKYDGKLFILMGPQTASASETFVLASLNIENSVRVGSNTEGILSDVLSKKLPNGWEYSLSNEVYEDVNGMSFEKVGIQPDLKLDYSKDSKLFYSNLLLELQNRDAAIAIALQWIKQQTK